MTASSFSADEERPPGGPFSGRKCPVIVGPTAVGKTGLVTDLVARFPLEVISLDSRQIYRGLRIGTAQPTAEEQAVCPHHLIDFISPAEKYDAIRFRRDFEAVYREVTERGRVPVIIGGAGMYLTALREGFLEISGSSPDRLAEVRAALNPLSDIEVRDRLNKVDQASFGVIHPNDRYRSQRALEIFEISGRSMSVLKAEQEAAPSLGLEFPTVVLERPVPEIDARIARRTDLMLTQGWLEETRQVMDEFPADCPGLKSIGYRQVVQHLQGSLSRDHLVPAIIQVTRQYAKRQRTWFRHTAAEFRGSPENSELADFLESWISEG